MTLLSLEGVTRQFGGLVAVDAIDLDVADGGVTAVIGPNGAGKTTLFNLISGFQTPNAGRIVFAGEDITARPPEADRRGGPRPHLPACAAVSESFGAGEHPGRVPSPHQGRGFGGLDAHPQHACRPSARSRRAPANCSTSSGWRAPPISEASALAYGQQRLLEIARALAAEPKLLLLDEPAAGLSADESKRLSAAIRDIAERGTTVLLIEHDMKLVMNTADTIAVLDFGRKIAEGTPAAVRENPAVIAAYLGVGHA